jgi:hypothetical protein
MNLNQVIDDVSKESSLPRAEVGKIAKSILSKFADLIQRQEDFQSQIVAFNSVTLPPATAADGSSLPARKVARMRVVSSD